MNLVIKHIDTFNLIKGILKTFLVHTNKFLGSEVSPVKGETRCELTELIEQMEKVPEIDDSGFFIDKPDPWDIGINNIKDLVPDTDYTDAEKDLIRTFLLAMEMHEDMGSVYHKSRILKSRLAKEGYFFEWVDDCIEMYDGMLNL